MSTLLPHAGGLAFHPLANLFPLIEGAEFEALVEDVRQNGVRELIVLHEGMILDGRNRYRAAVASGCDWLEAEERQVEIGSRHSRHFVRYDFVDPKGDPLRFVLSLNMHRRHLSESQRAMIAAEIATMPQGRPNEWKLPASASPPAGLPRQGGGEEGDNPANLPDLSAVKQADAAELLHVSERSVRTARQVVDHGAPELVDAVKRGDVAVSAAAEVSKLPVEDQREILGSTPARELAGAARARQAVGARRVLDVDSLDYFPTPPWATRALVEDVLAGQLGVDLTLFAVREPACGEGHISGVLEEYSPLQLWATDIFDYSADGRSPPGWVGRRDFLDPVESFGGADWIITNPPFSGRGADRALAFVLRALEAATTGVAVFVRTGWAMEGVERYEQLFRDQPPTLLCPFVERVPLHEGRWEPDGSSDMAYSWLVWMKGEAPRAPFRIPPGRRVAHSRTDDIERFTAHPVIAYSGSASGAGTEADGAGKPETSQGPVRMSFAAAKPILEARYATEDGQALAYELGIPIGTLRTWAFRAGLTSRARIAANGQAWAERQNGREGSSLPRALSTPTASGAPDA